jgi:nitrogen fixation/metabolism regulation signal transduction histidine kinase
VHTIVDQVDAMKRLVNEFRDYARLPAAELKPVDLNALVNDVLHLYAREGDATRGPRRCRCAWSSTRTRPPSWATRSSCGR